MTATTAPRTPAATRWKTFAPLALFFLACFLFAGVLKFNLRGGDLWVAKPAGAPITCAFLAVAGLLAGRWFFGAKPNALPRVLLATLVVLLPVMGLLGVVHLATHDPISAANDPTPLGGALGSMLAGPRAFGALGTTVAGITFALLAVFGGYLARRITAGETPKPEDPYAAVRSINTRRVTTSVRELEAETKAAGVAVAEAEPPAGRRIRGELFPHDAELEPVAVAAPVEDETPRVEVRLMAAAVAEPPRRMPILAGIVTETAEEEEAPMPFVAAELLVEPEPEEALAAIPLDEVAEPEAAAPMVWNAVAVAEPEAAAPVVEEVEEAGEETLSEARPMPQPAPDADDEPGQQEIRPARPSVESDEPTIIDPEEDEDPTDDDAELGLVTGGEAPELTPEWIAAPGQFHNPRFVPNAEILANEALFDILDVERAEPAAEPEAEVAADPEIEAVAVEPVAEVEPETPPARAPERPRFRIKAVADYVSDEPKFEPKFVPAMEDAEEVGAPAEPVVEPRFVPAMDEPAEVEAPSGSVAEEPVEVEAPRRRSRRPARREPAEESQVELPVEAAPAAEVVEEPAVETPADEPAPAKDEPSEVEAQLSLPSMPEPAAPAEDDADKDSRRPRRRRAAQKDWAAWDEPGSRERPRLRLVKDNEEAPAAASSESVAAAPARGPQPREATVGVGAAKKGGDDAYDRAVALVVAEDRCSVSLLQRNLGVTFGEATALIDRMYQQGVVGPYQPTGRRDVLKKKSASAEES
jgi:DNA segregation ATPase FtsK/SpoIIIE-like protein